MVCLLVPLLVVSAAPLKLAMVDFRQVGLSADKATYYSELLALRLAEDEGLSIVTPKDVSALLGMERQKELLGCSDASTQCVAELAGALGTEGIVTGQLAKVGDKFQLSVKIIAADGRGTLYQHASQLLTSEEDLVAEVQAIAKEAPDKLRRKLRPGAAVVPEVAAPAGPSRPLLHLTPAAVGVVLAGVGAGLAFSSKGIYDDLSDQSTWATRTDFKSQLSTGKNQQTAAEVMIAAGSAALIAGVLWYLLGGVE
jgi:hypothetical protein